MVFVQNYKTENLKGNKCVIQVKTDSKQVTLPESLHLFFESHVI